MALSKTDICNKSLTLVGANPLVNLTDDTRQARTVNRVYESALRSILSECCWAFATKRALLGTLSATLAWYYTRDSESYVYQRPNDCIRIFGTNDDDAIWRLEGEYIISDTSGLGIKYVYYLDSPTKYASSFIEAFSDKLSSDIAFTIVNSTTKATAMLEKYEKVSLPKALAENAQLGKQQYLKDDEWELSKHGNQSGSGWNNA